MRTLHLPLGLAALLLSPLVASAPSGTPVPGSPPHLTLEQAQDLATARSFELSAARREIDASEGAVRQAGALRNPELSATVEDARPATRVTTTTLGFPLELGGKRAARVGAAERARELASAQLAEARARVRAGIISAYFSTVVAQERVQLAIDSSRLADRAANVVGKRVAAGKTSPVDASRARVDAANAELEVGEAQAELQAARHALAALWGDAVPGFGDVAGDTSSIPARASEIELLEQVDASPALLASRLEIDRRLALVEVERSKTVPDLVLTVGARRDNELGLTQAVVGVSIPLPLFDRNQGAVHEASRRADKARDDYDAARVRLMVDVRMAASQLATARAAIQTLRGTVLPAAQQAYDASTTGFEAGKFGFLDVIDSQRSLIQARARYLNTLSSAWQAAAAIDRLLGR
jgi:cobalt-zinc-cadmium efflux system outer membrane protein